jgi:hypothetical protein
MLTSAGIYWVNAESQQFNDDKPSNTPILTCKIGYKVEIAYESAPPPSLI